MVSIPNLNGLSDDFGGSMTPGRQVPDSDVSGQNPGDLVVWIVKHKEQACEEFQLLGINIDMKEMGKCIK